MMKLKVSFVPGPEYDLLLPVERMELRHLIAELPAKTGMALPEILEYVNIRKNKACQKIGMLDELADGDTINFCMQVKGRPQFEQSGLWTTPRREEVLTKLCKIMNKVGEHLHHAFGTDCFCFERGDKPLSSRLNFQFEEQPLRWLEMVVDEKIKGETDNPVENNSKDLFPPKGDEICQTCADERECDGKFEDCGVNPANQEKAKPAKDPKRCGTICCVHCNHYFYSTDGMRVCPTCVKKELVCSRCDDTTMDVTREGTLCDSCSTGIYNKKEQ